MRILGVDPGLLLTGYGVIEWDLLRPGLVDGGVIRLRGKETISQRLVELERELEEIAREYRPEVCAVEQVYSHYAHPRTSILMGHARGVILLVAQRHGMKLVELAANRVKQAVTGRGHASKQQMQAAIQATWKLKEPPSPPDVADALAIALAAGRTLPMPPAGRRGMAVPMTVA